MPMPSSIPPIPSDTPDRTQASLAGSPQQGGAGGYVGVVPTPQDALTQGQGGDILLRQQSLLKQISSLTDQLSNIVTIAPFLQDEAMMMLQLCQSMQMKVMTIAGQDVASSQQGQMDAQQQGQGQPGMGFSGPPQSAQSPQSPSSPSAPAQPSAPVGQRQAIPPMP